MPKILEDRVAAIKRNNKDMPASEAYGIATKQLKRSGSLKTGAVRRRKVPPR